MMRPELTRLGPLEVLRVEGALEKPCIILFHGFGADAYDLYPLHQVMSAARDATWIFPNAPLSVPIGAGLFGRAWFPIDVAAIEAHLAAGTHRDYSTEAPEGLAAAHQLATGMLKATGRPLAEIILGGFSQGAMLATEVALHAPESPAGLIILSGTLLKKNEWQTLAPRRAGLRFFQSHGSEDPLLPFPAARLLNSLLNAAGLQGKLIPFHGGHEIPESVLIELNRYLAARMAEGAGPR